MQLRGSRISGALPDADVCGSPRTIRRFGLPASETESHSPFLGGSFRDENVERNSKAHAGVKLRRIRSTWTNTPLSPTDSSFPNARLNLSCVTAVGCKDVS
jgi:hypothetical protein